MREIEEVLASVSMFTMVNDRSLMIESFDILQRILNLLFTGYEAADRKLNAEALDIFLTTFMSIDPKQFYKRKLKFEDSILSKDVKHLVDQYHKKNQKKIKTELTK